MLCAGFQASGKLMCDKIDANDKGPMLCDSSTCSKKVGLPSRCFQSFKLTGLPVEALSNFLIGLFLHIIVYLILKLYFVNTQLLPFYVRIVHSFVDISIGMSFTLTV